MIIFMYFYDKLTVECPGQMQNFNLIKCVFVFVAGIHELIENNDLATNEREPPVSMSMHLICLHSLWNLIFNESLMPSNIAKATRETNMEVCNIENRRQTDKKDLVQICFWVSMYSKSLREYE